MMKIFRSDDDLFFSNIFDTEATIQQLFNCGFHELVVRGYDNVKLEDLQKILSFINISELFRELRRDFASAVRREMSVASDLAGYLDRNYIEDEFDF